jgi:hypothetical protein
MQIYDNVNDILNGDNSYFSEVAQKIIVFQIQAVIGLNAIYPIVIIRHYLKIGLMIALKIMCSIVWVKKFLNIVNHFSITQKLREN